MYQGPCPTNSTRTHHEDHYLRLRSAATGVNNSTVMRVVINYTYLPKEKYSIIFNLKGPVWFVFFFIKNTPYSKLVTSFMLMYIIILVLVV